MAAAKDYGRLRTCRAPPAGRPGPGDRTADATVSTQLYKRASAIGQATYELIPFAYRSLTSAIRPSI
jgi:hypothetical protein